MSKNAGPVQEALAILTIISTWVIALEPVLMMVDIVVEENIKIIFWTGLIITNPTYAFTRAIGFFKGKGLNGGARFGSGVGLVIIVFEELIRMGLSSVLLLVIILLAGHSVSFKFSSN
ncbi:MAG: hypothetical protein ACTSYA_01785 [Candidatus Kariarchaeaceae archaeon]